MFTDNVKLSLRAGKGGNGVIAWIRAKYIPKGGPCGGDGGKGGSVIFRASNNIFCLDHLRNSKNVHAENGRDGSSNLRTGRNGKDKIILLPCGTLIKDSQTGELIYDLTKPGEEFIACKGGKGGFGNDKFKSATNRAPRKCTPGKYGQEQQVQLELKLIADVGLVGMPNAGKSTLLSALTARKVKIGDYPFTTLTPNLSYIEYEDYTRTYLADIPGILEGAHADRGLGLQFLKHIERSRTLIYLIDLAPPEAPMTPYETYLALKAELEAYNPELLERPSLVVLNKIDLEGTKENLKPFQETLPADCLHIISAKEGSNLEPIKEAIHQARPSLSVV